MPEPEARGIKGSLFSISVVVLVVVVVVVAVIVVVEFFVLPFVKIKRNR